MHTSVIISASPWDSYDKPKGKPGVPEVGAYGLIFVVFCLLIVLHQRKK
jgi:hypothetical protein